MTIALKIGNEDSQVQGFIYLDAVTKYGRNLSGKVTSFPMDSGSNVSNHFISNNQKFTISCVISDVDITGVSDRVRLGELKPLNAKPQPSVPDIAPSENSLSFLPSAVKQFFSRSSPTVGVDLESKSNIAIIEMLFEELMRGVYYNSADNRWRNKVTVTTIYEMDGADFSNARTDLIITDIDFEEDPDSGDALFVSMSLEKVRFAVLEITEVGRNANTTTQNKVSDTKNKGTPSTEEGKTDTEDPSKNTNPTKAPIANKLKDAISDSKKIRDVQGKITGG